MKGKILGFADAAGVIVGDDGKRYKFASGDWKAPRTPRAGEEVDYEISPQGMAAEIYPLRSSAGIDLGDVGHKMQDALGKVDLEGMGSKAKEMLAAGSSSPAGKDAIKLLTARLSVPVAIVLLIVSVFFSYISWQGGAISTGDMPKNGGYSVLGVSSFTGSMGSLLDTSKQQAGATVTALQPQYDALTQQGDSADAAKVKEEMDQASSAQSSGSIAGLALDLMYLLYLIPLGCAFILFREWQGNPMPLAELAVGGLGVFSLILAYVAKMYVNSMIAPAKDSILGAMGAQAPQMSVAFGAWLLFLGGGVLLANALGIVRLGR